MGRAMPNYAQVFAERVRDSLDLIGAVESARVSLSTLETQRLSLSIHRTELIYELAFLRIFVHWESFLEETFMRYLCGYECAGISETPCAHFFKTIADAQKDVNRGRPFILWHNPYEVEKRAKQYFDNGRHENAIAANLSRLKWLSFVRHRIAHANDDARRNFDTACMSLCGRRFRGGRPGRFLRDWTGGAHGSQRWLEVLAEDLSVTASLIAPFPSA